MRFTKGLNKDSHPSNQPEGTYRNATNLIINKELGTLTREDGNSEVINIGDYNIIDTLSLSTEDEFILFCNDDVIRLLDLSIPSITDIVDANFNFGDYIDATFTSNNEGERIIYFVDGVNQPRFVNIDINNTNKTISQFSLFPSYNPKISVETTVNENGGSLVSGSYYLAFRYVDSDNTTTNVFYTTNPILIGRETSYGLPEDVPTSKSIDINISDIDTKYDRIEILSIKGTTVDIVQQLDIVDSTLNYTFSGNEGSTIGTLEEVLIDNISYDVAKTLTTQNQNLYIGGLDRVGFNNQDKIKLQEVALNATISCEMQELGVDAFGILLSLPRKYANPQFAKEYKSWKRGEVYALYVSFLLDNGRETEAFHIPGREEITFGIETQPITTSFQTNTVNEDYKVDKRYKVTSVPNENYKMGYWENENEFYPDSPPFNTNNLSGKNVRHHKIPDMWRKDTYANIELLPENNKDALVKLEINNLDISTLDNELQDKIVGYKLYHAKKNVENRVVLDQCALQPGWLDTRASAKTGEQSFSRTDVINNNRDSTQESNYQDYLDFSETQKYVGLRPCQPTDQVFNEDILTTHGIPENYGHEVWGSFPKVAYGRPLDILSNDINVQGITFVKALHEYEYAQKYFVNAPDDINSTEQNYAKDSEYTVIDPNTNVNDLNQFKLYKVKASTTVDNNQRDINLSPQGFSYNMDNIYGESKLVLEFDDNLYDYDVNDNTYIGHRESTTSSETIDKNRTAYFTPVKRNKTVVCDLIQLKDNVHNPFYNQQLVDTGFTGYFDDNGQQLGSNTQKDFSIITIFNDRQFPGDTFVSTNYYRAHTLAAIGSKLLYQSYVDARDAQSPAIYDGNLVWSRPNFKFNVFYNDNENESKTEIDVGFIRDRNNYPLFHANPDPDAVNEEEYINGGLLWRFPFNRIYQSNADNVAAYFDTVIENTGETGGMFAEPIPFGTLHREDIESHVNIDTQYSTIEKTGWIYPQNKSWIFKPEEVIIIKTTGGIFESRKADLIIPGFIQKWLEYYKEADNYKGINNEYQDLQTVSITFPWNPNETLGDDFKNRVIRSSNKAEDGESNNFRKFLQNDFLDVNRNRGSVNNLEIVNNNLIIHTDRSLIQTRGRDRLQTQQSNDVFLGSGNIFQTLPNEIISTDVGFGGLQHNQNTLNIESGYIWIDNEQEEIFNLSQNELQTLSSHEFGLYDYWNNKLSSEKEVWEIGTDRSNNRVLFVNNNTCISYYPQYQAWVSEHSFNPDNIINHLNTLYTVSNNKIYQHGDYDSLYSLDVPINLEFSIPIGVESKLSSIYYRSEGDTINKAIVETLNDTTGELDLEYNVSFKDAKYLSNNNLTQVRNRKGLYWINNLRSNTSSNNIRFSKNKIISNYFIIKLYNEITNKELNIIEAGAKTKQKVL